MCMRVRCNQSENERYQKSTITICFTIGICYRFFYIPPLPIASISIADLVFKVRSYSHHLHCRVRDFVTNATEQRCPIATTRGLDGSGVALLHASHEAIRLLVFIWDHKTTGCVCKCNPTLIHGCHCHCLIQSTKQSMLLSPLDTSSYTTLPRQCVGPFLLSLVEYAAIKCWQDLELALELELELIISSRRHASNSPACCLLLTFACANLMPTNGTN